MCRMAASASKCLKACTLAKWSRCASNATSSIRRKSVGCLAVRPAVYSSRWRITQIGCWRGAEAPIKDLTPRSPPRVVSHRNVVEVKSQRCDVEIQLEIRRRIAIHVTVNDPIGSTVSVAVGRVAYPQPMRGGRNTIPGEGLVARDACVGVDCREIDLIVASLTAVARKIGDRDSGAWK